MKPNVGRVDRVMRIIIGLGLLSLLLIADEHTRWWGLIGLIPLATGIFRRCPAYLPFGINSCEVDNR